MAREAMKKKRAEKKQHIIDTATQVFAEKGYHGALTDEIAARAEISKRSMYYYVGDKDTLYEAVINNLMDIVRRELYYEYETSDTIEKKLSNYIQGVAKISKMMQMHSIVIDRKSVV
jgi:AcrR family transcriptional regulator